MLNHINPFQKMKDVGYGFLWIANILNSNYSDRHRYLIAGTVVQLLGKRFNSNDLGHLHSSWIPPLLDFLSLGEKFYTTEHQSHLGFIALRMLSCNLGCSDFTTMVSPILTPILAPTHPLQSRSLALGAFCRFRDVWFSQGMENVPYADLNKLLRAVGDPFQFLDPPLQDREPAVTAGYKPMQSVVILIEFSLLDLWRNHLHHSNFTSCEGILSTEEGRRTTLESIFDMTTGSWLELFSTPANVIASIRHLEELQCLNTAEVVILCAWTVGVVNALDNNAWGLIKHTTLNFYQTHGIGRLTALSRHITDTTMEDGHLMFLLRHYQGPPCQVGSVQQHVPFDQATEGRNSKNIRDLRVAQVCQLRRLYHLFGYDPTTWKEVVGVKEVPTKMDAFSGHAVMPIQSTDWRCDYP